MDYKRSGRVYLLSLIHILGVTQHCRLLVVSGVELLSDMLDELEAR